jgi:hypothetical protein
MSARRRVYRTLVLVLSLSSGAVLLSTCATMPAPPPLPLFPWPPPQASATEVIPSPLVEVESGRTRLRDVDRRITAALEQNGYYESSYYAVTKGFALVTKMEQIESDGTPKEGPQRWVLVPQRPEKFTLARYITALFGATPGHYRTIVFIVTPGAFTQSSAVVTREEANAWLGGGLNRLPASIGNLEFSREDYACTALIYEFERPTETEEATLRLPGLIPGRIHLVKAGIWGGLER